MGKDQGKKKTKQEQKQIPTSKEKRKIKSTELTDAELAKVSGGSLSSATSIKFLKVE